MLSGALAGILRVGAVLLTAGGLGGGIYFLVQVGQEEDASRLQAPEATATLSAPGPLSPPDGVTTPTTPTPTFPPAPITPPAIDTSDWKTYTSPLGFSFKYPPDWTVVLGPPHPGVVSPETARAMAQEEVALAPGMAQVEVWFDIGPFDVNAIIENCERPPELSLPGDQPDSASVVTFLGRRAVQCLLSGVDPTSRAQWLGLSYIVELSPDRLITVAGRVVPQGDVNFAVVEGIIASFTVEHTP